MIIFVGHIPFCTGGVKAEDCYQLKHKYNKKTSGVYQVYIGALKKPLRVYCDMDTDGGGWTVCSNEINIKDVPFYNNL